ncbi:MAG: histidine--tRNA ligase [Spirochaetales bacterium]|nr:histidine--tRNA ligase [Spirochaetales bacterium]
MSGDIIEPKILKGFRDFLPEDEGTRKKIQRRLEDTFESFGFVPIDTPVLEYAEVLLGKGGGETDKQVYRFLDNGKRDVSMRFDLTVPFARYVAAHLSELYLPFKRYHIAKVWRGENTQRGRYREFMQCDFDIVGVDSASADFEILDIMRTSMRQIGVEDFTIHLSHRGLLNRFLRVLGLENRSVEVLRAVDKIPKMGKDEILVLLSDLAGREKAKDILAFTEPEKTNGETLTKIENLSGGPSPESERLRIVFSCAEETGMIGDLLLNPGITRGLDYYTGIVFETFLTALPGLGSVCSGGRYNNLASLYTPREIPGVGSSIGLDRLLAGLEELDKLRSAQPQAHVIIMNLDENLTGYYHNLASELRKGGLGCEVYHEKKKLGQQFNYAEKKHIPLAVICGEEERSAGVVTLKNLVDRQSYEGIKPGELVGRVRELLPA